MTVVNRLFGVKWYGNAPTGAMIVTGAKGSRNVTSCTPISFVNGVNNTAINGPVEIDYTLYSVGTAAGITPPAGFVPSWYWLQVP